MPNFSCRAGRTYSDVVRLLTDSVNQARMRESTRPLGEARALPTQIGAAIDIDSKDGLFSGAGGQPRLQLVGLPFLTSGQSS